MDETTTMIDILVKWKADIISSLRSTFDSMLDRTVATTFSPNMNSGELEYESDICDFHINEETGNLEWGDT